MRRPAIVYTHRFTCSTRGFYLFTIAFHTTLRGTAFPWRPIA